MIAIGSGIRVGEPICGASCPGRSADDGSEGEGEMIILSNDPEEAEQQMQRCERDNELRPVSTCNSYDSHNSIAIGRYVRYKKEKKKKTLLTPTFALFFFSLLFSL